MTALPRVKSVMSAFPYSIDADAPIDQAFSMMDEHDIRHLPVTADGKLLGVISENDAKTAATLSEQFRSKVMVRDVCTCEPYTVDLNEPLYRVVEEMAARRIGSTIVTKDERIAGIFTTTDACRFLAESMKQQAAGSGDPDRA